MNPLHYFVKSSELDESQQKQLDELSSRDNDSQSRKRDGQRLARALHKAHIPVLLKHNRAGDLARHLQGQLGEAEVDDFLSVVAADDGLLSELAFTLRRVDAPPPPGDLEARIMDLFIDIKGGGPGRSRDVFGENSVVSADSLQGAPAGALRSSIPGSFAAPGPSGYIGQSVDSEPLWEKQTGVTKGLVRSASGVSPRDSLKTPPASWRSGLSFALIGAGAVLVLGFVPLLAIAKKLFKRARIAEIQAAKAEKQLQILQSEAGQLRNSLKAAKEDLIKRPSLKEFKDVQSRIDIYYANFNRANDRAKLLDGQLKELRANLQSQKENYDKQLEEAIQRERIDAAKRFPDLLFSAVSGREESYRPSLGELVEYVKTNNDREGVAAFFLLEERGFQSLAVSLAANRAKLSLLNFLARPFLTRLTQAQREWDLLAGLLHKSRAIREASVEMLKLSRFDLPGYQVEMEPKRANIVVASFGSEWERRHPGTSQPYTLPFNEGIDQWPEGE